MGLSTTLKIALIGAISFAWLVVLLTPAAPSNKAAESLYNTPRASTVDRERATTTAKSGVVSETDTETKSATENTPAPEPPLQESQVEAEPVNPPQETKKAENERPILPFSLINDVARGALVNIVCAPSENESTLSGITGSGIVIHESGLILTNAHIGQYFLFDRAGGDLVDCIIRTGTPARPAYIAELVYLSPRWIEENKTSIAQSRPRGTGEYDYAFLRIEGAAINHGADLKSAPYPHISPEMDEQYVSPDTPILLAAYPASFLTSQEIQENLYIISAVTTIKDVFTFTEDTLDLFSTGGSAVAQRGASGGAVVSHYGDLIGVVTTSSSAPQTGDRDLRAISIGHIDRSLQEELSGATLDAFLASDFSNLADDFNEKVAPALRALLFDALESSSQ